MRNKFNFGIVFFFAGAAGFAQEKPEVNPPKPEEKPAAATVQATAKEILDNVNKRWAEINDYHCKLRSWNRVGDTTDMKFLNFWFKKPQQARSEVLEGTGQGNVVIREADGRIRARKGGLLSALVITVKEDDERIRNIRGKKFYEGNWGVVLGEFTAAAEKGWKLERLKDETLKGTPCIVISVEGKDPAIPVTKDVLYVDPKTWLVRMRRQFEGTMKVNEANYTEVEINTGAADELFKM